jgi:hypothetical protein
MKKLTFFIHDNSDTQNEIIPGAETELMDLVINGRHLVVDGELNEAVANEAIENMNRLLDERQAEAEFVDRGGLLND